MANLPPAKTYIPDGFKKYGGLVREVHLEKIKAMARAYGVPDYRLLDKLLERALRDLKVPKKRDLGELD